MKQKLGRGKPRATNAAVKIVLVKKAVQERREALDVVVSYSSFLEGEFRDGSEVGISDRTRMCDRNVMCR